MSSRGGAALCGAHECREAADARAHSPRARTSWHTRAARERRRVRRHLRRRSPHRAAADELALTLPAPRAPARPPPARPPRSKPGAQPITLKIREHDGSETLFKVKRSTPMERVFKAFYTKKA